ncbi:MAG: TetR/AcrR family transcriptional regulator [Firmicutes bacterium]|nr:TetR/AcrR family transcriptional regulator [Bacillota bacterium]
MSLTRQKIIDAATTLFNEKGYSITSVQDIAEKLNVTKAALYYYISSKEEILYAIFDQTMTTAEKRLEKLLSEEMTVEEKIRGVIYNHIMAVFDEAPRIAIFFTEQAHLLPENLASIRRRQRDYEERVAGVIGEGMEKNILRKIEILPTVYAILGMCNWLYHWYEPTGRVKPADLADLYAGIVLSGILRKPVTGCP